MNEVTTINPNLSVAHNRVWASSEDVARAFGKRHDHVLRELDRLMAEAPPDFRLLNFEQTEQMRPSPLVEGSFIKSRAVMMTRDGFMLLAMGFTGREAMRFKIAWLEAFGRMEAELARAADRSGLVAALQAEALRNNPQLRAALRYRRMGLSRRELGLLLRVGETRVHNLIRRLRELGFIEPAPAARQLPLFRDEEAAS